MTMGSLFSGCGGFDLGFAQVGFDLRWQVEIDAGCLAILTRHWPTVRKVRDIHAVAYGRARNRRRHGLVLEPVDVIVSGFPCQDLSIAGQRAGLSGSRSGLFFALLRVVRVLKPTAVVIENVPGLFSLAQGRDFARVLDGLDDCGYVGAWRVLDSQYFGVAQRRRRVFLVASARASGIDPAAVLFESVGGEGDSAARAEAGAEVAACLRGRAHGPGSNAPGRSGEDDVNLITFDWQQAGSNRTWIHDQPGCTRSLSASKTLALAGPLSDGNDAIDHVYQCHGTNIGPMGTLRSGDGLTSGVPFVLEDNQVAYAPSSLTVHNTRHAQNENQPLVAVGVSLSHALTTTHTRSGPYDPNGETFVTGSLGMSKEAGGWRCGPDEIAANQAVPTPMGVRRLTPLECERLQAFPDGWTCLCGGGHRGSQFCTCPDTPRYRMLGNAVTVSVSAWIARHLHAVMTRIA